ncbi:hypothetical protein EVAR_55880_1 [Eumeta japonica]|uniref:Secreted protein n=1 Tax=Eumeta variegata TaxID=151549 RepID=A0A4C1YHM0_EUMVA|nr:hypothetical protein EVAR_55880_1 [Eumeta japonica]
MESWFSLFACIFSMRCSNLLLLPLNSMIISARAVPCTPRVVRQPTCPRGRCDFEGHAAPPEPIRSRSGFRAVYSTDGYTITDGVLNATSGRAAEPEAPGGTQRHAPRRPPHAPTH